MKKVAILGFGKEGQSALRYFREQGADITIFDENPDVATLVPEGVGFKGDKGLAANLDAFDIVVRSPSMRPDRIKAVHTTSVINIFFEECQVPIIGVTGSKGKGTVCSLIFEMLTRAGVRAHLAGNIGVPALDILPDIRPGDVVILELSSFQLWDITKSPHVAVVLMIEADHLDVHADMDEYVAAKANIARYQDNEDMVMFHPTNTYSYAIAKLSPGKKVRYGEPPAARVQDGIFVINEQKICSVSDLLLPGKHNEMNACAAITAAWQYTHDTTAIREALKEFGGLPHRLKFVAEKHGVNYYDDSIATTPGSAIAAINAFATPKILILGGSSKGADFSELAKAIKEHGVRHSLLIGDEAKRIATALDTAGVKQYQTLGTDVTMEEIVEIAADKAEKNDVVILSPACASFGMFKSYQDRGEQFIAAVQQLL